MGVKIAVLAAATVLSFVQGRAQPDGGYAESTVAAASTAIFTPIRDRKSTRLNSSHT